LPLRRGSSQRRFWASLPYLAMTSMLPVSGAAQLVAYTLVSLPILNDIYPERRIPALWDVCRSHTSLAVLLLPKYSAIKPYSKLLYPAPSLKWFLGKNIFQRPNFLAFVFRSSMTAGCDEKRCSVVSPIWR
jgi:hypothetical protein